MSSKSSQVRTGRYPYHTDKQLVANLESLIKVAGDNLVRIEVLAEDQLIRVTERVEGDVPLEDEIGWDGALSNTSSMEEYISEGAEPFQVLVDMTLIMRSEGYFSTRWIVGRNGIKQMSEWLTLEKRGMPTLSDELLGVPITEVASIPLETLILCGAKHPNAGPEELKHAVKYAIDMRSAHEEDSETCGRCGHCASKCTGATGSVEAAPAGARFIHWKIAS